MEQIHKMTVKEMWEFCLFQAKGYKILEVVLILGTISAASIAYVNSFLYAKALNALLEGQYQTATVFVVKLVGAVWIISLIAKASGRIFEHYIEPSQEETKKRTAKKAFQMEFEEIEKEQTLEKFRKVQLGERGHGGVRGQLEKIYQYFTNCVQVVFATGFVLLLLVRSDLSKEGIGFFLLTTGCLLALFAAVLAFGKWVAETLGKLSMEMNARTDQVNAIGGYVGVLYGERAAKDVRIYQMRDYLMKKYQVMSNLCKEEYEADKIKGRYTGAVVFALELLAGATYVYIALKVLTGSVQIGDILMYAGAIITMMNSIREMMSIHIEINYSNEYLRTYEEFINLPNMHYDGTLPIEKRDDNRYELEFCHVSFKYPGTENDILRDVNLKFEIGGTMALVGRNGAGKTTLIKLLLRFYEPTEGAITLNGIDIGKYDYDEYMKIFSVVFQDFELYHFPLDENIAGSEKVNEARVREVIRQVGLENRVAKMKNGIHTSLYYETGEGEMLSGGEAQKVAIARALYKDAPFVILDEPTAALDPLAEVEIYEKFDQMVKEKTAIYISHRMSSCKFCDRIVVLQDGKITEIGTHEELIKRQGEYFRLYEAQAKYYVGQEQESE